MMATAMINKTIAVLSTNALFRAVEKKLRCATCFVASALDPSDDECVFVVMLFPAELGSAFLQRKASFYFMSISLHD
jgi:hypothetical protein